MGGDVGRYTQTARLERESGLGWRRACLALEKRRQVQAGCCFRNDNFPTAVDGQRCCLHGYRCRPHARGATDYCRVGGVSLPTA